MLFVQFQLMDVLLEREENTTGNNDEIKGGRSACKILAETQY